MRRRWSAPLGAAVGILAFSVAWSILVGRDLNWDFLNYHLYAGFAAGGDRIAQDYFPASIQSYLPGLAYVPLAAAVRHGWSVSAVQVLLALQVFPTLFACWLLAGRFTGAATRRPEAWRVAMVVAAVSCPVLLTELGTSFADAPTAAFPLLALWLLLHPGGATLGATAAAGALAGIACGLKMSNVPMVAGLAVLPLLGPGGLRDRLRLLCAFIAGAALAFAAVYGWWGWKLYQRFGNPFFPILFNDIFRAPEYLPVGISLDRFKPLTVSEFLLRPLYMLDPVGNVYTEVKSPDARYLVLCLLALVYLPLRSARELPARRPLDRLLVWLGVTWVLWLLSSGNGRYALPLALAAGVACGAVFLALAQVLRRGRKLLALAALVAVSVQALALADGTTFRWNLQESLGDRYFAPELPARVRETPHVVVTLTAQSMSWMAPFIHPQSVLTSPTGQYLIKPQSPAGQQLRRVLTSGLPVLVAFPGVLASPDPVEDFRRLKPFADLYGLRVDLTRCDQGAMDRVHAPDLPGGVRSFDLMFCPASLGEPSQPGMPWADLIFDRIEAECPQAVKPPGVQTLCAPMQCSRAYVNTDTVLTLYSDGNVVLNGFGGIQPVVIGHQDALRSGGPMRCPSVLPGRYIPFSSGDAVVARQR